MTDKETAGVYITSAIETLYKIANDCDEEEVVYHQTFNDIQEIIGGLKDAKRLLGVRVWKGKEEPLND